MSVANSAEDTVVSAAASDFVPEPEPGLEHGLALELELVIELVVGLEVELEAAVVVEAVAEYDAFAAADSAQPVGDAV